MHRLAMQDMKRYLAQVGCVRYIDCINIRLCISQQREKERDGKKAHAGERERKRLSKKKRERERERGRYEIREREGAKRHVDHSLNCIPFVKID